jgi:N-terminal acetyltransferase B complex non-catalytic subunit
VSYSKFFNGDTVPRILLILIVCRAIIIAHQEIEAHIDRMSGLDKTYRRNAVLAFLEFRFFTSQINPLPGPFRFAHGQPLVDGDLDGRVFALCRYLYKYGHSCSAFDDIKIYIVKLDVKDRHTFIKAAPHFLKHLVGTCYLGAKYNRSAGTVRERFAGGDQVPLPEAGPDTPWNDIMSGITLSKLSYFIKSSLTETTRATFNDRLGVSGFSCYWCNETCGTYCTSCLQSLATESLQNYYCTMDDDGGVGEGLKSTDQHPADEWAILVAMSLIKLAGCRPWIPNESHDMFSRLDAQQLLRAALTLEYAHTHSKPNPQILLLLIRLYSQLGAGSLAIRAYGRLGIKQVQGDTLSYTLFDRISSLHPHMVDDSIVAEEARDPSKHMKKLQRLYRNFRNQIITNSWRSFEHGSYDSIFQLMDVSGKLSGSMTAAMCAIELRRIDRLTQPNAVLTPNSHGYDVLRKFGSLQQNFTPSLPYN